MAPPPRARPRSRSRRRHGARPRTRPGARVTARPGPCSGGAGRSPDTARTACHHGAIRAAYGAALVRGGPRGGDGDGGTGGGRGRTADAAVRAGAAAAARRPEDRQGRLALLPPRQPAARPGARRGRVPDRTDAQSGHPAQRRVQLRGRRGRRRLPPLVGAGRRRLRRAGGRVRAGLRGRAARPAARRRRPGRRVARPRRGLREDHRGARGRPHHLLPALRAARRRLAAAPARLPTRRRADLLRRAADRQAHPQAPPGTDPAPAPSRLRAVALLPVDYGVFCAVFLLLGSERAFRLAYLALFAVHALFLAAFLTKWFRRLRALPAR